MEITNLVSINQLGENSEYNFPHVLEERKWYEWYHSRFGTLLPIPSIENGLALLSDVQNLIQWNPFYIISSFHRRAVLSEPMAIVSTNPEFTNRFEGELANEFYKHQQVGAMYWGYSDLSVWVVWDRSAYDSTASSEPVMDAIDPSSYFRVGRLQDSDDRVGHKIVRLYYTETDARLSKPNDIYQPEFAGGVHLCSSLQPSGK